MDKTTRKVLVDNLGRVVGLVKPRTGHIGDVIEYGGTRDGCLDVIGIATIERRKISTYMVDELRVYDGNGGRMVSDGGL